MSVLEPVRIPWVELDSEDALRAWNVQAWSHVRRVAWLAAHWPGEPRLEAASRPVRSMDVKLGNKVAYMAFNQANRWGRHDKTEPPILADRDDLREEQEWSGLERTAAATVNWWAWVPAQLTGSMQDRDLLADWVEQGAKLSGERRERVVRGLEASLTLAVDAAGNVARWGEQTSAARGFAALGAQCGAAWARKIDVDLARKRQSMEGD